MGGGAGARQHRPESDHVRPLRRGSGRSWSARSPSTGSRAIPAGWPPISTTCRPWCGTWAIPIGPGALASRPLELHRSLDDRASVAATQATLAGIHWSEGNLDEAERLCRENLAVYRDLGLNSGVITELSPTSASSPRTGATSTGPNATLASASNSRSVATSAAGSPAPTPTWARWPPSRAATPRRGSTSAPASPSALDLEQPPVQINLLLEAARALHLDGNPEHALVLLVSIEDHDALKRHIRDKVTELVARVEGVPPHRNGPEAARTAPLGQPRGGHPLLSRTPFLNSNTAPENASVGGDSSTSRRPKSDLQGGNVVHLHQEPARPWCII